MFDVLYKDSGVRVQTCVHPMRLDLGKRLTPLPVIPILLFER